MSNYSRALKFFIENNIILNKNQINLLEGYFKNQPDIYYNKDKFDNGDINLCFVLGLSGSGKTTMTYNMTNKDTSTKIERYELDDLLCVKDHFSYENLKEYGDLIYSYFTGPGKEFYLTKDELWNYVGGRTFNGYEDIMMPQFVKYAINYAKTHKDKKYVIEGVWLYCKNGKSNYWFNPADFKDYAVYIKGTSALMSFIRATKRDTRDGKNTLENLKNRIKLGSLKRFIKYWISDEKDINRWRNYFGKLSSR